MRTSLGVAACALVAASACGELQNPARPATAMLTAAVSTAREPARLTGGAPVNGAIAAARRATAAFHDPAVAAAAGYLFNEPCQQSAAGAMGIHAPKPALVSDGVIDPERPEVLLYLPQPDGTLRLVGVEYMQLVRLRNPATGVVAPWRSASPWPPEYEVVTPTPELFGQTFQGPMPGHSATMPWHWDLHVWLWAHNPDGMFAPWNPALDCG